MFRVFVDSFYASLNRSTNYTKSHEQAEFDLIATHPQALLDSDTRFGYIIFPRQQRYGSPDNPVGVDDRLN